MKISFTALIALSLASQSPAADWPNFRGPDHNGISKETGWSTAWPAEGPKQLWKAKVGMGFASFAVSGGRAYTTGNANNQDSVFCFDAASGKELWKHSYAAPLDAKYYEGGTSATPTVDGDRVFTLSKRGVMHCLDAAKGSVVWSNNLVESLGAKIPTWGFAGSALVLGDAAYVNVGGAGAALDKKSGKVIWKSDEDVAGYSTPVPVKIVNDSAVLLALKDEVAAVATKDGKELWKFPWKTEWDVNAADPILSGNLVFVSSGYNHGGAAFDVSAKPPKQVWENKSMRNHFNSCVLWQNHVYGMDENQLRCLALDSGEVKWTETSTGKGSLMLADGKLIVLGERGELMVAEASAKEFKPLSRAQVIGGKCWSAPVLANGRIYCRNAAGDVVCVDVSGK